MCESQHQLFSTDPRILSQIPQQEYIPFILFHRSAVTRSFARSVIGLVIEGMSLSSVERYINSRRIETMMSLDSKVLYVLHSTETMENPASSILNCQAIDHMYKPFPSNDLIMKCFTNNFLENKDHYFCAMTALVTSSHISLDHTFKVAANIGCLRSDGRWAAQYNSVLYVQNDVGQVISWMFTKTTSLDEAEAILKPLRDRLHDKQAVPTSIIVDNCCQSRQKLQRLFGNITVSLDIFHAVQRITRVLPKRHSLFHRCVKDLKLLFRDASDLGERRLKSTPNIYTLEQNLNAFQLKWKDAEIHGQFIFNDKITKEIESLRVHIRRGCLSNIAVGAGTNKNEALHRSLKPFFSRCRMGTTLAVALMTILLHHHNQRVGIKKLSTQPSSKYNLTSKASYIKSDGMWVK